MISQTDPNLALIAFNCYLSLMKMRFENCIYLQLSGKNNRTPIPVISNFRSIMLTSGSLAEIDSAGTVDNDRICRKCTEWSILATSHIIKSTTYGPQNLSFMVFRQSHKNTEIGHDSSLLLAVERVLLHSKETI